MSIIITMLRAVFSTDVRAGRSRRPRRTRLQRRRLSPAKDLAIPEKITLVSLPAYARELNPKQLNSRVYLSLMVLPLASEQGGLRLLGT
jgi:hypothetical protein